MPEPPEDADAYVEHPDLDQAVDIDDHGPAFDATLEGLDDVAEDQGSGGVW
jgi:hypothetical protein